MIFEMLPEDDLYRALLARDPAHDGHWYVGVRTTGVFCRSTCAARKPKRENCEFLPTQAACLEAGYRPCKRCHPMRGSAQIEPLVEDLAQRLQANPAKRWFETDVLALGHDPSTVRRAFKRVYGVTFLELARLLRLREGFGTLKAGERVIDAQVDAGFASASGFRDAFARLLGVAPGSLKARAELLADWIDTPLGPLVAVSDQAQLHLLEFHDRRALATELKKLTRQRSIGFGRLPPTIQVEEELKHYFAGDDATFRTPLKFHGSAFVQSVWQALRAIPAGQTRSYSEIARAIGRPEAVRAVARANGANQLAIVVPCHRVLGSDGSLTGYGGGLWRKRQLIETERRYASPAPA
ncbi:MAG: trifunctional transcriptional activator/DNA repair protein Ada/methylated-DNA--[protein]-cysteine S-methyltransferase [Pseudomonadota bacterium]